MKRVQLTQEGYNNLVKEIDELKNKKRSQAVERLQKARAMGDLSENSEYSAAKEDLAFIEGRIMEIETMLTSSQVIQKTINNNEAVLGSSVTVRSNNQVETYKLVGEFEADPLNRKLSITSPIGKAFIGKRRNDIVEVNVPAGKIIYQILDIQ